MKSVVEPLEGNKVKLSIEVDEAEFERSVDAAFRKIAREVRVPGFRPGKAPRRLLEARLGAGAGRAQALDDSLPEYYAMAVLEHEVDVIAPPEIDVTAGADSGAVAFDAVVEVRPHLVLEGYDKLRVVVPNPAVSDEDVSAQLDRQRANFGELVPVDRPVRAGDRVTVDLAATRDGEPVAGVTTDDFLYEVGSGTVLPELDEHLPGAKVGDILSFQVELPDGDAELRVLLKEVKEQVLPELTDEWASEASEYETVAELQADLRRRLSMVKRMQAIVGLRNGTVEALADLVADEPPAALVQSEIERRAHDLGHRLDQEGATLPQWLEATGQTEEDVVAGLRVGSVVAVKVDLALRAVAEAEGLEPTEEELEAELGRMAEVYGMGTAQLTDNLQRSGQMPAVRSELKKSKALDWLVEHVELVDPDGNPVDRSLLREEGEASSDGAGGSSGPGDAPTTDEPTTAETANGEA